MSNEKPLSREERLAQRLRDNLRRRKAQARAMTGPVDREGESTAPSGLSKTPPAR